MYAVLRCWPRSRTWASTPMSRQCVAGLSRSVVADTAALNAEGIPTSAGITCWCPRHFLVARQLRRILRPTRGSAGVDPVRLAGAGRQRQLIAWSFLSCTWANTLERCTSPTSEAIGTQSQRQRPSPRDCSGRRRPLEESPRRSVGASISRTSVTCRPRNRHGMAAIYGAGLAWTVGDGNVDIQLQAASCTI